MKGRERYSDIQLLADIPAGKFQAKDYCISGSMLARMENRGLVRRVGKKDRRLVWEKA